MLFNIFFDQISKYIQNQAMFAQFSFVYKVWRNDFIKILFKLASLSNYILFRCWYWSIWKIYIFHPAILRADFCLITSSSLSMASLSFLLLSRASSHTCCHLVTSRLTRGFLVSMGACVADAYMVCVGERFPVRERQTPLPCNQEEEINNDIIPGAKMDKMRMSRHPAVNQHWARWLGSRSMRGNNCGIHTSCSSFAKHGDLRLVWGLHGSFSFVCLGDFVNIGLLPGHFLHECLQGKTSIIPVQSTAIIR